MTSAGGARWGFLDALRGFGVAGILLVNCLDITMVASGHPQYREHDPVLQFLYFSVQTRFVPIFVFLFGMSLWFIVESAQRRGRGQWLVLFRRLVTLAVLGGALMLVYPGNILIEYGIVGLLILRLVLLLPRWALLIVGLTLTAATYGLTGGGLLATPGLMLLGAGACAFGMPAALEKGGKAIMWTTGLMAAVSAGLLLWQFTTPGDPRFSTAGGIAGLAMAVFYIGALSLLWRTPARRVIAWVFEPLGRMALSNYVAAALIFALAAIVIDFEAMSTVTAVVVAAIVLLIAQSIVSRFWLRRFVYGPIEWIWRIITWWGPVAIAR